MELWKETLDPNADIEAFTILKHDKPSCVLLTTTKNVTGNHYYAVIWCGNDSPSLTKFYAKTKGNNNLAKECGYIGYKHVPFRIGHLGKTTLVCGDKDTLEGSMMEPNDQQTQKKKEREEMNEDDAMAQQGEIENISSSDDESTADAAAGEETEI